MDDKSLEMLEFPRIREILAGYTSFSASRELAMTLKPLYDFEQISRLLRQTAEARQLLTLDRGFSIGSALDIREKVRLAALEGILEPLSLLEVQQTLAALHEGRIQVLLVSEGYRETGFECSGCGFHTAQAVRVCPFCGNSFRPIEDAVEHAVQTTMLGEGEVEIIRGNPELESAGRIAAILRY
jgi:hypothetical protein